MKIERQTPSGKIVEFEARGEVFARFIGPDAEKNAVEFESIAALRAENEKLRQIVFTVANLSPATRDYNPGVGAGMLNQLIEAAKAALAKEGK